MYLFSVKLVLNCICWGAGLYTVPGNQRGTDMQRIVVYPRATVYSGEEKWDERKAQMHYRWERGEGCFVSFISLAGLGLELHWF